MPECLLRVTLTLLLIALAFVTGSKLVAWAKWPRQGRIIRVKSSYERARTPDVLKGITSVMTLCCRHSVPNASMVQRNFESMIQIPTLREHIVLGFDGHALQRGVDVHEKCKGSCHATKYDAYINDVVALARLYFREVEYVVAPSRVCLTLNLKAAIAKVKTDFIYVCQEDLPVKKYFDVPSLMNIIANYSGVELIRIVRETNAYHMKWTSDHCRSRYGLPAEKVTIHLDGFDFTRCDQFSDQNHITYVDFYTDAVWPHVHPGDFMEDQLICAYGSHPHLASTMWFLGTENEGYYIEDLDGRNARLDLSEPNARSISQ